MSVLKHLDINGITYDIGEAPRVYYGTCDTGNATAVKAVVCHEYTLTTPCLIGIYFTTGNIISAPTLNINSTGAKDIYKGGTILNGTSNTLKWSAHTILYFLYDGTYYRYMSSIAADNVVTPEGAGCWYGSSSTTASTAAKTCAITNFSLKQGAIVSVTFSTANTVENTITLNINSTGAKSIYKNNVTTSSSNTLLWEANTTLTFVYGGSYWHYLCQSRGGGSLDNYVLKEYEFTSGGYQYRNLISNLGSQDAIVFNSYKELTEDPVSDNTSSHIIITPDLIEIDAALTSISNIVTPTNPGDAANKNYVDTKNYTLYNTTSLTRPSLSLNANERIVVTDSSITGTEGDTVSDFLLAIVNLVYPVGSYYETSDTTFNPNTAWTGTWVLENEGLVHIGAGENYTLGSTGGTTGYKLTVSQIPQLTGTIVLASNIVRNANGATLIESASGIVSRSTKTGQNSAYTSASVGTNQTVMNTLTIKTGTATTSQLLIDTMQPYVVVNRWHRTA